MKVLEIEKDVVYKTQKNLIKACARVCWEKDYALLQKELGELEDEEEIAQSYEEN